MLHVCYVQMKASTYLLTYSLCLCALLKLMHSFENDVQKTAKKVWW